MRRILILLSVSIAVVINLSGQAQIPNSGFEEWVTEGSDLNPAGWMTTNNNPLVSVTQYTPAHMGDFSMKVSTFEAVNMTFAEVATLEFTCTERPAALNACLKTSVMPGDRVLLIMAFFNGDSIVALPTDCTFSIDTTLSEFTCFSFPVTYYSSLTPDSAIIIVMAGSESPMTGTEIIVDELSFTLATHNEPDIESEERKIMNYPNPAAFVTYIPVKLDYPSEVVVRIWDLNGRMVQFYTFPDLPAGRQEMRIDTTPLENGIYGYSVTTQGHTKYSKLVISR